jgi:flavodoxin
MHAVIGSFVMKTAIIYYSYHHMNTEKIARRMSAPLEAVLMKPEEVDVNTLAEYDLIGLGSGIFFNKHHKSLLKLVDSMPEMKGRKAFIFSTAGRGEPSMAGNHRALKARLGAKGFVIVGEFSSYAWDTFFLLWLIGGINKGRPNEDDLAKAENFAKDLAAKF